MAGDGSIVSVLGDSADLSGRISQPLWQRRAVVELAAQYGRLAGLSYVFNAFSMTYIAAFRSMEHPQLGMYILATSMAVNTFLNWVFIFGNLGAPALGVQGRLWPPSSHAF